MPAAMAETSFLEAKNKAFCGCAKIPLRSLRPEDLLTNPRQLDPKNITRLLNVFRLEGCLRLEPEHHVPAIVNPQALDDALRSHNLGRASLKTLEEPVSIDFRVAITYLHGAHRLEAASQFLQGEDKWWIVDLYLGKLLQFASAHLS